MENLSEYADAIWGLLWEYIANESSDYDYKDIGEELCERVLPNVWNHVLKMDEEIRSADK